MSIPARLRPLENLAVPRGLSAAEFPPRLQPGQSTAVTGRAVESPRTFRCCDVQVAALSPKEAVAHLRQIARSRVGYGVHLCNALTLSIARKDPGFARMLNRSNLNLPDGTPVTWVGRINGHRNMTGPVRGSGLLLDVMRDGVSWGATHYLYGSSEQVIEALGERLSELVPGSAVVGLESPPFRDLTPDERAGVVARVTESGAHYVWVGLGTPRQDDFVHAMSQEWSAVTIPVGAAFDFIAGSVKEAPTWLHGTGLEWVFRLCREPGRLWRRYLFGNPRFLMGVLTERARIARETSGRDARPSLPALHSSSRASDGAGTLATTSGAPRATSRCGEGVEPQRRPATC